jgi:drug/metabolite transporter (DMT)-like permease
LGAVLLITNNGEFSLSNETSLGDGFVLINATSYGLYLVIVKPLMSKYSAFTIIKWIFLFGFIYVLPFGLEEALLVNWGFIPLEILLAIGFVVIFTTFFAYLLNILALKELSPSIVSYYIYLQPVLASLIALYFEKDEMTFEKGIAALFIFLGVFLISSNSKKTT